MTKYCWRSVDALLTLNFRMWLGVWVCLFRTSRRLIRRKWTVTYQCQYFTMNSSISERDHKYETWNAEPEIGTDGSSQTRRNPQVDGQGSGFVRQESAGRVFGRFWKRTDPFLRSKPGQLAGYPDPLLTLLVGATRVSGRFACSFRTNIDSADGVRRSEAADGCNHSVPEMPTDCCAPQVVLDTVVR